MPKSRSGSLQCHCEEPKATKQSQRIPGGEEKNTWPGQNSLPHFLALEGRGGKGSNGQPEMRQAKWVY
jgi:hypothetical protein